MKEARQVKELYTALFSGAVVVLVLYMAKELMAKSPQDREKYLEDEKAAATVAETLLPLV